MEEVADNIFMITEYGALGAVMPPVNLYVLAGPEGLLFDAGYGRKGILNHLTKEYDRIREVMAERGQPCRLTRVLPSHSHPDHASGLAYVKKKFGVRVLLTHRMATNLNNHSVYYLGSTDKIYSTGLLKNWLANLTVKYFHPVFIGLGDPPPADQVIPENHCLQINGEAWQVLPAPGHCDDHITLYNQDRGILFSGDNVMRVVTTWLGPPRSDLALYTQTIEKILDLPHLKLILSAHGRPVTNPRQRLQEILAHRRERTEAVWDIIQKHRGRGVTPQQIVNAIYKPHEVFKRYSADGWVVLTLKELEQKGWITHRKNRFFPAQ